MSIPYEQIKAASLAQSESLLFSWFPNGKQAGDEFKIGNISGDPGSSLSINTRTGMWSDFAGDEKGGDLISLFAKKKNIKNGEAAIALTELLGITIPNGHDKAETKANGHDSKAEVWQPIMPAPDNPPPVGALRHWKHGAAAAVWVYRSATGEPNFAVVRFDLAEGGKEVLPYCYGRREWTVKGGPRKGERVIETGWHFKRPKPPIPLYGLETLSGKTDASVLVVEGEKATDAARKLFADMAVVTSQGGSNAAGLADWSPLAGRGVVIWPDHDKAGAKYAAAVVGLLKEAGAATVRVVDIPKDWPDGWDLADPLPIGTADEKLVELYDEAKKPEAASVSDDDGLITEDSIALAFAERHENELRFDHNVGSWFRWNGQIWLRERTKLAFSWSRAICRELAYSADADDKVIRAMSKAATAAAVERFAESDRAFAVTSEIWDSNPLLLGTAGGTVDLKTGKLRPAEISDYITKITAVTPAETADCPLWLEFLKQATGDDAGLIKFLQQWFGYCLTGDTREHALVFVYGPGGNGKSVMLNIIALILGDYACTAAMETFVASNNDRHPTELAMLRGARMASASETEEGRPWAESRIKQLTGGDRISARFMRQDFFEFLPQFKLAVIGNNKPVLSNVDDAAKRRFNIIPFVHKPEKPDSQLEAKLREEMPGILRWLIDGCLDWQKSGLTRPDVVTAATAEYFSEQDGIRQWVEECCDTGKNRKAKSADLFKSWTAHAIAAGERAGTSKRFSQNLVRLGCTKDIIDRARGFKGIELKHVDTSNQWQNRQDAEPPSDMPF
jgi:putative DNA primase/helicase